MNLNLINIPPKEWSKEDWNDAYSQYCKANMFGPKTKREYYDMVLKGYEELEDKHKLTPVELLQKWVKGREAAKAWAQKRGCDMNGRMLTDVRSDIEKQSAISIATRAEKIAIDTKQDLEYLVEKARQRRVRCQHN